MDIRSIQRAWDELGRTDPLWAVLSEPDKRGGRWDLEEFLATGGPEIAATIAATVWSPFRTTNPRAKAG